MINILDPPKLKGRHLVMSTDLERALIVIQKGAEERLEVLKTKKSQLEKGEPSGDTVPKLIGHIEKMEPGDNDGDGDEPEGGTGEENIAGGGQTASKETEDQVGGRQMANGGTEKEKQTGSGQMAAGGEDDEPEETTLTMPTTRSRKMEESEPRKKCSTQ